MNLNVGQKLYVMLYGYLARVTAPNDPRLGLATLEV